MALADLRAMARAARSVSHVSHVSREKHDADGDGEENAVLTPPPDPAADEAADRAAIAAEGPRRAVVVQPPAVFEGLVTRLAAAMAGKHGQRITDPERAGDYFQGEARRRLWAINDPMARGLLVGTFEAARCFCGACQKGRGDD